MTVAPLGFQIDTSPLAQAVADLDRLTASTRKAEAAAKQVSTGTNAAAAAAEKLSSAAKRAGDSVRGAIGGSALTAATQYAQAIDRAAKSLSGFEAIAARAAAEAEHVVGQMQRMTSADIRNKDIQAYGSELDRLRGKFSPLFREISRYRTTLGEIRQAHAVGAITTDEMTAAISRERQASLSAIGAIKGRTQAIREADSAVKRFHTTNLVFQAQDIAMMAAMGQAPHILAMQQGTQVAGIFHQIGNGRQIVEALKGALIGLINPISLATVGIIGLGTAAYQYLTSGSESVNRLDTVLENHKALIDEVKATYGDAAIAASDYARKSAEELDLRLKASVEEMKLQFVAMRKELLSSGTIGQESVGLNSEGINAGFFRANREFELFREQIAQLGRESVPNIQAIRQEIVALGRENGAEAAASKLLELLNPITNLEAKIRSGSQGMDEFSVVMRDLAVLIDGVHSEKAQQELKKLADEAVNGGKSTNELKQALAGISGYAPDLSSAISQFMQLVGAAKQARAEIVGFSGRESQGGRVRYGTTGFMQLPDSVGTTPTARVDPYFQDWRTPERKARKTDAERAAERYQDMIRQSQQFIAAQELEQRAMFMTEEAANALRYEQELLNQAANNNIKLTPEMAEELRKLASDMAATEAETTRLQEALKFGKDLVRGFVSDLRSGLEQGKGFWESFADAALNALDKVIDKIMDDLIDALFEVNKVGSSGGIFDWLFNLMGGGVKLPSTAPVPTPRPVLDSGGAMLGAGLVSFGPRTRMSRGLLQADSGFGPRNYLAVLEKGETVLTEGLMSRNMRALQGLTANQNHANQNVALHINVQNNTSAQVEIGEPQQNADGGLSIDVIINEIEGKMEASMRNGRLGRATQQTFGLQRKVR